MTEKTEEKMGVKGYLRLPKTKVALISLAHGTNDMYSSFLPTFLPFIRERLGLSYALAGNFNFIVGIFHIFCQPAIGYISDRIRRPIPIMLGPILCGLGATMIPNVNSYAAALLFAGLWGLGSALFHPQGTGGIGYVSAGKIERSMAWYNISGTLGGALSPFIAVGLVMALGYRWLPVAVVPALLFALLVYFSMPFIRNEVASDKKRAGFFKTFRSLFVLLYPFWGISMIRDLLFQCLRFFLPMKIVAQGGRLESVGVVVFCLTLACIIGIIPIEKVAARFGGKKAISGSLLAGSGILLAAAFSTGIFSIVLYTFGLACVYSTIALTTTMAQNLAPNERSTASTIVQGLAWGVGNVLVTPFGKFADLFGIDAAFILLALLPVLVMPLLLTRPFKMVKE